MARFNEILEGRFNRALQKISGIKGAASTPQLGTEIMPVFPLFWGAESRYLEGWILHSWETVFAASAANLNAAMLRNPVGSNVVAVFHKVLWAAGVINGVIMSLGPKTTDLPTPVTLAAPSNFDQRFGSVTRSIMLASIQQAAGPSAAPPDRAFAFTGANTTFDFINDGIQEFPLLPGWAVNLRTTVVNTNDAFSFWWRERPMTEQEQF
jgi:hypothetical protein